MKCTVNFVLQFTLYLTRKKIKLREVDFKCFSSVCDRILIVSLLQTFICDWILIVFLLQMFICDWILIVSLLQMFICDWILIVFLLQTFIAISEEEVIKGVAQLRASEGPALLEIKAKIGARHDLGRPKTTPVQNKEDFMHFLALSK